MRPADNRATPALVQAAAAIAADAETEDQARARLNRPRPVIIGAAIERPLCLYPRCSCRLPATPAPICPKGLAQ